MNSWGSTRHSSDDARQLPIQSGVAAVHVVNGVAREQAAPFAQVLSCPPKSNRSHEGEELCFLFSLAGEAAPPLCRQLRDIVAEAYWSTSGSVTSALRRSVALANRHLFEHNLNARHPDRCYGGMALAVLQNRDLFLVQAGPVWACVLQGTSLRCFPRGERLAHLGIGPVADVRLHHVLAAPGDTLLMAPHALLRAVDERGVRRILSFNDIRAAAASLPRIGVDAFVALLVRWDLASERRGAVPTRLTRTRMTDSEGPPLPARTAIERMRAEERADEAVVVVEERIDRPIHPRVQRPRLGEAHKERGKKLTEALGKAAAGVRSAAAGLARLLGRGLSTVGHGIAAIGAGLWALGRWLVGALLVTIRRTLPGQSRGAQPHSLRHPPPKENSTVMTIIAAAIPIIILTVVLVAYRQFATRSRFEGTINRAKEHIAMAQAEGGDTEMARPHWERALEEIEVAAALEPEHPVAQILRDQTREALDQLDGIHRLALTQLADFGSSNAERRMVLAGETIFVLDGAEGWVAEVPTRPFSEDQEPEADPLESRPVIVHTGQRVDGDDVEGLVDCVWVDAEGGRRTSALLILDESLRLVSYDPAWRNEDGEPQLYAVELAALPTGEPIAVGTYDGQFYVLDGTADGTGQIWRYKPQGDAYPSQPERYFASTPPQSLDRAKDMAIDGNIYVLHQEGHVSKFLGGESQPFNVEGIPGGLGEVAAFAVDPEGDGSVYIADRTGDRIIILGPDGVFRAQLRGDPAMASLEALVVNQERRRIWVLADGGLHTSILP